MASGNYASEDVLLTDALSALAAEDQEVKAIQASLDELDAGEPGMPVEQAFESLRARHGLRQ